MPFGWDSALACIATTRRWPTRLPAATDGRQRGGDRQHNDGHVLWLDEHVPELAEFDLVMMSNEVGLHKPDPEIFRLALELLAVEPAAALFIDDLAQNVAAAQALGLAGVVHTDWEITRVESRSG